MSKLEDLDPFPKTEKAAEVKGKESRGSQIIKTELDTMNNVRYDVMHNFFGDEVAAIAPSLQKNWMCGYVTYPDGCPLPKEVDDEVGGEVDVHGGVTYTRKNKDGSYTYGFDCGHAGDGDSPRANDPAWVLAEAKRMHKDIMRLKKEWEEEHAKEAK
jgi:hypothetical protein